jgi:hypothetical protein
LRKVRGRERKGGKKGKKGKKGKNRKGYERI